MTKLFKKFSLVMASLGLIGVLAFSPPAMAIDVTDKGTGDGKQTLTNSSGEKIEVVIGRIISTLLFILGIAAVIIIILAGFRFATANGDQGVIKSARNTIVYAAIGLVVAILAYAIVGFVLTRFSGGS